MTHKGPGPGSVAPKRLWQTHFASISRHRHQNGHLSFRSFSKSHLTASLSVFHSHSLAATLCRAGLFLIANRTIHLELSGRNCSEPEQIIYPSFWCSLEISRVLYSGVYLVLSQYLAVCCVDRIITVYFDLLPLYCILC